MTSVIIVNYHSAHLAKRAVTSLFQENEDVEVIIVDNTATRGERDRLHDLFDSRGITLILNQDNVGFAGANNQAFSIAKGDFILLLNPDAYLAPPYLGMLRDFLSGAPEAGAVSPQVYWDDDMRFLFPRFPFPSPLHDCYAKLSRSSFALESLYSLCERKKNLKLWTSSLPLRVKNLHGGVVLVRRSSVEQAGGLFDERFFLFYEDTDLFFRLRKKGFKLYIVPKAKAVHNYSHKQQKLDIMARTRSLYYEKHFNKSFLLRVSDLIPDYQSQREYTDYGIWNTPPSFSISPALGERYLFEWSPNPLFIPSIGCFGSGERFILSEQVWTFLDPGIYYSRITDPRKTFSYMKPLCWRKEG